MSITIQKPVGSQANSTQKHKDEATSFDGEVGLTNVQQIKRDALALAELIYNIFKDSLSNGTIGDDSRKDKQNV